MTFRFATVVERLAPRELYLVLSGVLLLAAILIGAQMRPALSEMVDAQKERTLLDVTVSDGNTLQLLRSALEAEIAELSGSLGLAAQQKTPDQMTVDLIGELNRRAGQHAVTVDGVTPAGMKQVVLFDEMSFEMHVAGKYRALAAWLDAIEKDMPAVSINQFDIRPVEGRELVMRIRFVAYRMQEEEK